MDAPLFAGVEAGGTKIALGIGHGDGLLLARHAIPTGEEPSVVITEVIGWLRAQEARLGPLAGIGVASFGPIDLDPQLPK